MSVYIFYHILCNQYSIDIVKEQCLCILFSGLYHRVDKVYCFLLGSDEERFHMTELVHSFGKKFIIYKESTEIGRYERFTLESIKELVNNNDKFLYIHSKGIRHIGQPHYNCVVQWRMYMDYFLFTKHLECIDILDMYDVVGVLHSIEPKSHFSGNFWWSKGSYYHKLPDQVGTGYWDPEFHVHLCSPSVYAIDSPIRTDERPHYFGIYPFSKFIDYYTS